MKLFLNLVLICFSIVSLIVGQSFKDDDRIKGPRPSGVFENLLTETIIK